MNASVSPDAAQVNVHSTGSRRSRRNRSDGRKETKDEVRESSQGGNKKENADADVQAMREAEEAE